jgi:hypothetical protein
LNFISLPCNTNTVLHMIKAKSTLAFFFILLFNYASAQEQSSNVLSMLNKDTAYFDVPNTNVRLVPPAHFIFMEDAGGFMHIGTSSSLQVLEVKGTAYTMITPGLTADYFKTQGVTLIEQEEVTTKDGNKGMIFTVSFSVQEVPFERLMFFTGNYNNTIWINANYPVAVKEMLNTVLKESLTTAQFKE